MNDENSRRSTTGERRASRQYMWEIMAGVVGFMATFLILPALVPTAPGSIGRIVIALASLIPVLWICIALVRHLHRLDELQRTLLLQSFAMGFGVAMLIAFTIALLSAADVVVDGAHWWVFIGGMLTWGAALGLLSFRAGR